MCSRFTYTYSLELSFSFNIVKILKESCNFIPFFLLLKKKLNQSYESLDFSVLLVLSAQVKKPLWQKMGVEYMLPLQCLVIHPVPHYLVSIGCICLRTTGRECLVGGKEIKHSPESPKVCLGLWAVQLLHVPTSGQDPEKTAGEVDTVILGPEHIPSPSAGWYPLVTKCQTLGH